MMADFCKQCSEELFGEDFGDFRGIGDPTIELKPDEGWEALCEGCGLTLVNHEGVCISPYCTKRHGE